MLSKEILEDLYINKRMSTPQIAKKFGIKYDRTVRKWMEKYNIQRRTLSESKTIYPKTSFDGNLKLKSYLLGLRAGDFHARRIHKVIRVQSTTTHPAQVNMMINVFGKFSHVGRHEFFNKNFNIKQWFIYCDLNESFSFMLEKPQKIPKWVFQDENLFYNFLSGYSDCESCWKVLKSHENSIRYVFQLGSQDKKILFQIVKKLKLLGYNPNIYLDERAGTVKRGKRTNLDMYRIMLYRTEDISRLISKILPLSNHQEKIDKMNLITRSRNKNWDNVKNDVSSLRFQIKSTRIQNVKL